MSQGIRPRASGMEGLAPFERREEQARGLFIEAEACKGVKRWGPARKSR